MFLKLVGEYGAGTHPVHNLLPDDKILTLSKLRTFADDKLNVSKTSNLSLIGKKKTFWEKE